MTSRLTICRYQIITPDFSPDNRLKIEDLTSLNGISVNGTPTKEESLSSGDVITIGKHMIVVDLHHDVALFDNMKPSAATPRIAETYVLDSASHSDSGHRPETGEGGEPSLDRAQVPSLVVVKGKTTQKEYLLLSEGDLIEVGGVSLKLKYRD